MGKDSLIKSTSKKKSARKSKGKKPLVKTAKKATAKEPAPLSATEAQKRPEAAPTNASTTRAEAVEEKPSPHNFEEDTYTAMQSPGGDTPFCLVCRYAKTAIGIAVAIISIILILSYKNSTNYYIMPHDNAIEIWKGRFSPKDNRYFMVLHGTEFTQQVKDVYSREEIFPLIFDYYLDKADTLLEVPGLSDWEGIKSYLHQAAAFSVTPKMKASVKTKLDNIERMILLFKAEVVMNKNTLQSLETALQYLKEAGKLNPNPMQAEQIAAKITTVGKAIKSIKAEATKPTEKK